MAWVGSFSVGKKKTHLKNTLAPAPGRGERGPRGGVANVRTFPFLRRQHWRSLASGGSAHTPNTEALDDHFTADAFVLLV